MLYLPVPILIFATHKQSFCFPGLNVPRSRFLPVKKTSDLLLVRSGRAWSPIVDLKQAVVYTYSLVLLCISLFSLFLFLIPSLAFLSSLFFGLFLSSSVFSLFYFLYSIFFLCLSLILLASSSSSLLRYSSLFFGLLLSFSLCLLHFFLCLSLIFLAYSNSLISFPLPPSRSCPTSTRSSTAHWR